MESPSKPPPNQILCILNDDCIQAIFRKLSHNVQDCISVSKVCVRFQKNAQLAFTSTFQHVKIYALKDSKDSISLRHLRYVLSVFGPSIKSIVWNGNRLTRWNLLDQQTFNMIADYCGATLLKLEIIGHNLNFRTRTPFTALEQLYIRKATLKNFNLHSNLKTLLLNHISDFKRTLIVLYKHFRNWKRFISVELQI